MAHAQSMMGNLSQEQIQAQLEQVCPVSILICFEAAISAHVEGFQSDNLLSDELSIRHYFSSRSSCFCFRIAN